VRQTSFEELLVTTGNHGVPSMGIDNNSALRDTTPLTSGLRAQDITVLAIERAGKTTPKPAAASEIHAVVVRRG